MRRPDAKDVLPQAIQIRATRFLRCAGKTQVRVKNAASRRLRPHTPEFEVQTLRRLLKSKATGEYPSVQSPSKTEVRDLNTRCDGFLEPADGEWGWFSVAEQITEMGYASHSTDRGTLS